MKQLRSKPKSLVTIVTTIVCQQAIILAADSRTTNADGSVRDDTQKVSVLESSDGIRALVGQSGSAEVGERLVEILTTKAHG